MKCTAQTRHRGCLRNRTEDMLQGAKRWCLLSCTACKALGLLAALRLLPVLVAHTYPPLCRHHAHPDHPWRTTRRSAVAWPLLSFFEAISDDVLLVSINSSPTHHLFSSFASTHRRCVAFLCMRLLGKAATARANAVTSPNMQPLAWCSAADGARRALRVTLVMLRSRQVTMLLATAQLCMHRERMWSCVVTRSSCNEQTMCKCASRCILLTLSERGVCKCSLTSSVSRIPTASHNSVADGASRHAPA
jgi:hypothetical protein